MHDVDDLHAELMEIDENLARSDLSPAQEAAHILRRKEIWDEIKRGESSETNCSETPISKRGRVGEGRPKEFAAELAEVAGASKVDINRKLRRARELGDYAERIVNTSLDKGVEMDALIKLPESERSALIERAASVCSMDWPDRTRTGHYRLAPKNRLDTPLPPPGLLELLIKPPLSSVVGTAG